MKTISLSRSLRLLLALSSCAWVIFQASNRYFILFAWAMLLVTISSVIYSVYTIKKSKEHPGEDIV